MCRGYAGREGRSPIVKHISIFDISELLEWPRCWFLQFDASTTHTQSPAAGSQAGLQTVDVSNDAHTTPSHQRR